MSDDEWAYVVDLYREIWKAYAEIATLKMMLKGVEIAQEHGFDPPLKPGWEQRVVDVRETAPYKSYLARGEAVILRAQQDRSEAALIEWLTTLPPSEYPN